MSLAAGLATADTLAGILKKTYDAEDEPGEKTNMPVLVGLFERAAFTGLIGYGLDESLPAVIPAMMVWLGLKLGANWNHTTRRDDANKAHKFRKRAMIALLVGTLSLAFAYSGGMICRWEMKGGASAKKALVTEEDVRALIESLKSGGGSQK